MGRRQARARRRHASGRASGLRLARELLRRGALPGQLGRAGRRLRRHARAHHRRAPGRADDPERPGPGAAGVPVDRVPGPLGRAAPGVLQRADGAKPEDAVDGADRVVGRLAHPQLHRPRRECVRACCDRLLLQRRRRRLESAGAARRPPARVRPAARRARPARDHPALPGDLAPVCSAPRGAPARLGSDPGRRRAHVRWPGSPSSSGSASCSCRSHCSCRCCRRSCCTRPTCSASRRLARATGWSRSSCSPSARR